MKASLGVRELRSQIGGDEDRTPHTASFPEGQGRTMAGYGASVGITTVMYYFELGEFLSFLVDDNLQKQHLISPGLYISVLPPQALYDRKPDYVLLLAWRYAEPIIQTHQAYLRQGGQFVRPLPTR